MVYQMDHQMGMGVLMPVYLGFSAEFTKYGKIIGSSATLWPFSNRLDDADVN